MCVCVCVLQSVVFMILVHNLPVTVLDVFGVCVIASQYSLPYSTALLLVPYCISPKSEPKDEISGFQSQQCAVTF